MIVYKLTEGLASDLRYEEDRYVVRSAERSLPGWGPLPYIESLHEPEAIDERARQDDLGRKRFEALRALEDRRLATALEDPDAPAEVKAYAEAVASNETRTK